MNYKVILEGGRVVYIETDCVGRCLKPYRIDPLHPEYERVKLSLDNGDRSVLSCYHGAPRG